MLAAVIVLGLGVLFLLFRSVVLSKGVTRGAAVSACFSTHFRGCPPCRRVELTRHGPDTCMKYVQQIFASPAAVYLSNRPQVSMGYRLINHAGCW